MSLLSTIELPSIEEATAAVDGSGRVTLAQALRYTLRWCNSYSRIETVLALKRRMFFADWWKLLGEEWSVCDNVAMYEPQLRRMLQRARPDHLAYMMNEEERAALKKLPRTVTVYRGCYGVNRRGLSWSLSKHVAMRFPTLNRYCRPGDVPLLVTGRVDRNRCALKLDRKEDEVISGVVTATSTETIEARVVEDIQTAA